MKRKASDTAEELRHGRRQPQTSCDSCRKRKLKCDRGSPCANCVTRGLSCVGQLLVRNRQPEAVSPSDSILRRLRALEEAVFNSSSGNHGSGPSGRQDDSFYASPSNTTLSPATTCDDNQHAQTAKILDASIEHHSPCVQVLGLCGSLKFGIAPTSWLLADTSATERGVVWMMPREQATALVQDYLDHVYPLLPVIHGSTTQNQVMDFYAQLSRGEQIAPRLAALILGIGAISAYFWQPDAAHHSRFASAEEAAQASLAWRKWAYDILTEAQGSSRNSTLEDLQAWTLLSFMVHNVDGCSYRFRFLHNCAVNAARELKVHLVDSPRAESKDDRVSRELKRRIWWQLAGTDWMLGFMGGPTEGTYSIHPRHMNVKPPRNLNDNDIATWDESTTAPLNVHTQMSFSLQRIRIAEITRSILDARQPGSPEVDITDYNQVLALDRLFEQAFTDLPPFYHLYHGSPFHPERDSSLELQRVLVQLGLLSRRARLHRPFLLQGNRDDPRHQQCREICLQSTRTAVSISIRIIESSLGVSDSKDDDDDDESPVPRLPHPGGIRLSGHRVGTIINHLFMTCTVLAFYAGVQGQQHQDTTTTATTTPQNSTTAAAVQAELAHACRVLAVLGAQSPIAAGLVRNLVGLLRRYRVQGVDGTAMLDQLSGNNHHGGERTAAKDDDGKARAAAAAAAAGGSAPGHVRQGRSSLSENQIGMTLSEDVVEGTGQGVAGAAANSAIGIDEPAGLSLSCLDGLWNDFIVASSDDYSQLFADLDYYCGST